MMTISHNWKRGLRKTGAINWNIYVTRMTQRGGAGGGWRVGEGGTRYFFVGQGGIQCLVFNSYVLPKSNFTHLGHI